jgi:threonine/homoserine/homoserine lactone efflux protein
MTLAAFAAIWFVHLLAAASPGPAVLMAARTGMTDGFRAGLWLAVGISIGALIWAGAALFGLAVIFAVAPALLWAFKLAGGAFLLWIAFKMWRHASDPLPFDAGTAPAPRGAWSLVRLGVLTQLANPKPAIFFGAVFVNTIPVGTGPGWIAVLLAMVFVNEFACTATVARAFSLAAPRRVYARFKIIIERAFGSGLALIGLRIAAT